MSKQNPDLMAAAILIWLPKGERPDVQTFGQTRVQPPPAANPEPWWLLHEAITYARTVDRTHDKLPWIKVGSEILSPEDIIRIHSDMGNLSNFSTKLAQG
jgi:hypothetical protein